MTTLLMVSGSQRRDSFNTRLLRHLGYSLEGHCKLDFLDPREVNLPMFDQDLELDPAVIHCIAELHQRFKASQGFIVASPEYNGQLTPYLKNIIDWVSRLAHINNCFENPFIDRPVLLCSASTGSSGGSVAIPQARALFGYVGGIVIGDTLCVPYADQAWIDDSYYFDPFFETRIDAATTRIVRLAQALTQSRHNETPI